MSDQLERVQASLLGARIGDALGQQAETMTRPEILETEVPGKPKGRPIQTFHDSIQRNVKQTSVLKAGDTTDDTQLTEVVAESYIACRGYNSDDMIERHLAAFQQSTMDWGGATIEACQNMERWRKTAGLEGRDPKQPPEAIPLANEAGNGVAIKIAPLGLFHGLSGSDETAIFRDTEQLTRLSHPHPESLFAAYALALVFAEIIQSPIENQSAAENLLAKITQAVQTKEAPRFRDYVRPSVTAMLKLLEGQIGQPEQIFKEISPNFTAGQSVIYSIGMFLTYLTNFRQGVLRAVNDGLDSDSTASMVGGLIGANAGLGSIPTEWQLFRPEYSRSLALGRELVKAAAGHSKFDKA